MVEEEIRTKFGGDRKRFEKYSDNLDRKHWIEGTQRRFIVKQFLKEFDQSLSEIEFQYNLPIREIIDKEILSRSPITIGGKI